jgi:serine phosphatase RsbU (regulator of sigma subunit)/predicted ester cyclase
MNKPPADVVEPGGWHHTNGVDPVEKSEMASSRKEAPVSTEEQNKAVVRRLIEEVYNRGNLDMADELLAPDYVDHTWPPGKYAGREGLKRSVAKQRAASSDLHINIKEQIAEGDKVVSWVISSGTHDRERFLGLAPTGERMTMKHIFISRVVEGKIVEVWGVADISDVWQQRLQRERIERERVEQELQVARRIQQASLPEEVPELKGWHIAPYYQPAREVGGDFYDFHLLSEEQLGVVVGDATGKGVPAALVMSTTCGMLQAVSKTLDTSSPGEVLTQVNETLLTRIPPNTFVTCFFAILDPKRGSLRYANAGHDLPYLHRNGEAEELRARGMPLGLMPGMGYEENETILEAGEAVLFYSDGLVEAHDPKGEMFGFTRLRGLVAKHDEQRSLGDLLMEELHSFVGAGWEQEDDITLLTLRRAASLS